MKLDQAKPITLHANGEPLLKRSSSYSELPTILLVVWSTNSYGIDALTSEASSNLLYDDTYLRICTGNCVIHRDK